MSTSIESEDRQRHELYVGVFHNQSWTSESLCYYFEQLIPESQIVECHFYPCTNVKLTDHSFAILTFISTISIDQCLAKHDQIKAEHRLIVKRNLKTATRDQRPICKYISVHLDKFDPLFNRKNILAYFSQYGSIIRWKILDNGSTFIMHFQDYDSVDCIFLDQPHCINEHSLTIRKCYEAFSEILNHPIDDRLREKTRNLQAGIDRSKYLHESELVKLNKKIKEDLKVEEDHLSERMKDYIRLERIQRDLQHDLINIRQINQQLKTQLQETLQRNKQVVDDFETNLKTQRSINQSLQDSISNIDHSR